MTLRQRLDELRTLAEKATPGILVLIDLNRAICLAVAQRGKE